MGKIQGSYSINFHHHILPPLLSHRACTRRPHSLVGVLFNRCGGLLALNVTIAAIITWWTCGPHGESVRCKGRFRASLMLERRSNVFLAKRSLNNGAWQCALNPLGWFYYLTDGVKWPCEGRAINVLASAHVHRSVRVNHTTRTQPVVVFVHVGGDAWCLLVFTQFTSPWWNV